MRCSCLCEFKFQLILLKAVKTWTLSIYLLIIRVKWAHLASISYSPLSQKSKSQLSRALSDLVVYCKSVHFHGFERARSHAKCYEMSSFSESKAKRLAKDAGEQEYLLYIYIIYSYVIRRCTHTQELDPFSPGTDFVQYNARHLSRIYPGGRRTDSSNYNPQDMWNVGSQMGEREQSSQYNTCLDCY